MQHWHGFLMDNGDLLTAGANSQALRSPHAEPFIKGERNICLQYCMAVSYRAVDVKKCSLSFSIIQSRQLQAVEQLLCQAVTMLLCYIHCVRQLLYRR